MLTVPEAARRIQRNPETIRRWIREGKLEAQRVGTQYLIDEADLPGSRGARIREAAAPYEIGRVVQTVDPWLTTIVGRLVRAFDKAKQIAYERVRNPRVVPLAWFSAAWEEQNELLGRDPWTYGLGAANRKNLEAAVHYTHQQGLIAREIPVAELFINTDDKAIREKDRI